MNSFELTQLALRIERLRSEVEEILETAPNGPVSAALVNARGDLLDATSRLDPYIGRAVRDEARGQA